MTDFAACPLCDAPATFGPARSSFREKLHLIRLALTQRCQPDDDWNLAELYIPFTGYAFDIPGKARATRLAYALKAAVCILMGRKRDLYLNVNPGTVVVAQWDFESWSSLDSTARRATSGCSPSRTAGAPGATTATATAPRRITTMPQTLTHNDRFAPGDQVELRGSHSWKGERGEIIARSGAFYGFAVRLENGVVVGAGEQQMRRAADA